MIFVSSALILISALHHLSDWDKRKTRVDHSEIITHRGAVERNVSRCWHPPRRSQSLVGPIDLRQRYSVT
jgi:hypothetical protein